MVFAPFASQLGKNLSFSLLQHILPKALQCLRPLLSSGAGLFCEVAGIEALNRIVYEQDHSSFTHNFLGLGIQKIFLHSFPTQNFIFREGLISSGMLLSHHVSFYLGLEEKAQGSIAEQWLREEAMNLSSQMGIGVFRGFGFSRFFKPNLDLFYHSEKPLLQNLSNRNCRENSLSVFGSNRTLVSEGGVSEVRRRVSFRAKNQLFNSEFVLRNFDDLLFVLKEAGTSLDIIHREKGGSIRLELLDEGRLNEEHNLVQSEGFPADARFYSFRLTESGKTGEVLMYVWPDGRLNLHSITTSYPAPLESMPRGAGGLFVQWLALQASYEGRSFQISAIVNTHLLNILWDNGIMAPDAVLSVETRDRHLGTIPWAEFETQGPRLKRKGEKFNIHGRVLI